MTSVQDALPGNEAIEQAVLNQVPVPGAEIHRDDCLRVALGGIAGPISCTVVWKELCGHPLAKPDFQEPIDNEIALRIALDHIPNLQSLGCALDARSRAQPVPGGEGGAKGSHGRILESQRRLSLRPPAHRLNLHPQHVAGSRFGHSTQSGFLVRRSSSSGQILRFGPASAVCAEKDWGISLRTAYRKLNESLVRCRSPRVRSAPYFPAALTIASARLTASWRRAFSASISAGRSGLFSMRAA